MSDVMLFGVLRMPYELAMGNELSRYQFWQRAQEAANRIEADESAIQAAQQRAEAAEAERDALKTLLRQIEADAHAQDVLFEWWSPMADALKTQEPAHG